MPPRQALELALDGSGPRHARLAAALRAAVAEGRVGPGEPLPSEADLAAATGLSRGTVRHALAVLRQEGLIRSRRGTRAVVLSRPRRTQPFSELLSFSAWARTLGLVPGGRVVELALRPAEAAAAAALGLDPDASAWELVRVRTLDGEPVLLERSWFPRRVGDRLAALDLDRSSVYAELARTGLVVAAGDHVIAAIAADDRTAALLRVPRDAPLLQVRRVAFGPDGAPLEAADDRYVGTAVELAVRNTAHDSPLARRPPTPGFGQATP